MTNKEKYKQAFSVLHASDNLSQEVESMSRFQKRTKMKTAAAVIAGCVILGGTGTAYAANVGGIQRTIQLWIHGDQTSATMEISNDGSSSSYQIEYQNADGTTQQMNGGGISETFTVRRVSYGVGVEKTFPVHSPNVEKVEITRHGKVRRAKLYYLRDRVGKSSKVKELI